VCNLYSSYTTQEAMRRAFEVARNNAGNVPPLPAIFPDQMAPVVRTVNGERELIQMRWGFPPPPKVGNQPVTNVRTVASPFWRAWLKPQYRALIPLTGCSEYQNTKPRKTPVWFALNKDQPLAAFAGIWRPWMGCAARGPSLSRASTCSTRSSPRRRKASRPCSEPLSVARASDEESDPISSTSQQSWSHLKAADGAST
jgi:putative SOS response-associated peptidase YedK